MNSATDHGFNTDWAIRVETGLVCRCFAEGSTVLQTYRVTDLSAPKGFRKVAMVDGPEVGKVFTVSARRILADAYAA